MNTKTTVVLVSVIVAAVLVIYLLNQPKAAPKSSSNTIVGQGASVLGGLFNLGAALVSKSGSKPSAPSSVSGSSFWPPTSSTDTASQQSYAISHDVTDQEGNQIIDLNTGNALVYGTD